MPILGSMPKGWRRIALAALLLGWAPHSTAQSTTREYQLKAVFLYHFTQFVEWPTNAFADAQSPMVIGVLGADPFGAYLDATVRDEKVNDHPLVVRRYRTVEEIGDCHVLFISPLETPRLAMILNRLKGRSILTVGESNSFPRSGGMIRFINAQNRIRLQINVETAKAAGLTISSKLLRPAEIVGTGY